MKTATCLLFFIFSLTTATAQIGPMEIGSPKKTPKQTLVETFKINAFTYKVFERTVYENDNGAYDMGEKGTDYYLYLVYKGDLVQQAKFAKEIKNSSNKISREGSYKVNGNKIEILEKQFTYHFGAFGTLKITQPRKSGGIDLISQTEIKIDAEKLSNHYVKDAGMPSVAKP